MKSFLGPSSSSIKTIGIFILDTTFQIDNWAPVYFLTDVQVFTEELVSNSESLFWNQTDFLIFFLKQSGFNKNGVECRVLYSNHILCLKPLNLLLYEFYVL